MHLRAWTINIALLNARFLKMTNSSLSKQRANVILVQAQIKQTWANCERWKQKKWSKRMSLASSVYSFHVLQVILVKISPHKVWEQIDFFTFSSGYRTVTPSVFQQQPAASGLRIITAFLFPCSHCKSCEQQMSLILILGTQEMNCCRRFFSSELCERNIAGSYKSPQML